MSDRLRSDSLIAALVREMVRVAGLMPIYRQVQYGEYAAAFMQESVNRAQASIEDWDAAAMASALAELRGHTL